MYSGLKIFCVLLFIFLTGCRTNSDSETKTETHYYKSLRGDSLVLFQKRNYHMVGDTISEEIFYFENHGQDSTLIDSNKFVFEENKVYWIIGDSKKIEFLNQDKCVTIKDLPNFEFENCVVSSNNDPDKISYTVREVEIDGLTKEVVRSKDFTLKSESVIGGFHARFDKTIELEKNEIDALKGHMGNIVK